MNRFFFFGVLMLACFTYANAQSPADIRAAIGKAVAAEVYKVDSESFVSVNYAPDGEVCMIDLQGPMASILHLADELVPLSSRGKLIDNPEIANANEVVVRESLKEYEKVKVRFLRNGDNGIIKFLFRERRCIPFPPVSGLPTTPSASTVRNTGTISSERYYGKYETSQPAVLLSFPSPELTLEALKFFKPEEMIVELVLKSDGTLSEPVLRGYLRNGMGDRVLAAVRKIRFKPAVLDGRLVSQRVTLKYGIRRCRNGKICTYVNEIVY